MDTNAKSKRNELSMQERQKGVVETDSKSSKIIDPGASRGDAPSGAKGQAT